MQKNIGTADKIVRILLGLVLLSLLVIRTDDTRWIGLVGLVPLLTAMLSWCPLYTLLGISTCPSNK